MTIDRNERLEVDAPSITALEADTLFYWHLKMAAALFELLPAGAEFNGVDLPMAAAEAIENFFNTLTQWYKDNDE